MRSPLILCALTVGALAQAPPADAGGEVFTFKSDVSLVRVDVQVVGRDNRAISGLTAADFVLRDGGQLRDIRNFSQEDMPVDTLFLIDVSGSMRPHVERLASAARSAVNAMGRDDRVALMVFDRRVRLRSGFQPGRSSLVRAFDDLLASEEFDGGTDITRGLLEAAHYVRRNARAEARHAIVILTDDQTERDRDEMAVNQALTRADAVLSALVAPNMTMRRRPMPGPRQGGGWPDIIFGGGRGGGGNGPVIMGGGSRTQSAGTREIARESGGDSFSIDDGEALETTLTRIRQRYALYFAVPNDARPGQERHIEVALAAATARRHAGSEVRFRRTYITPDSQVPTSTISQNDPAIDAQPSESSRPKRRPGVIDESRRTSGPTATSTTDTGWRKTNEPATATATPNSTSTTTSAPATTGGWRKVKPGEQP